MATLTTGQKISICDVSSNPIVVRGRSPRNFAGRKDAPTSGSISRPKPPARQGTGDSIGNIKSDVEFGTPEAPNDFAGITSDPWSWKPPNGQNGQNGQSGHQQLTTLPPDTFRMPANDFLPDSSPDLGHYTPQPPARAPINLSLLDDDPKKPSASPPAMENTLRNGTPGGSNHKKAPRLLQQTGRAPSFSLSTLNTGSSDHDDGTDPLYEYFPLGLDDWQEPVDAVYRPHVVHHINIPSDLKAGPGMKNRSKRLFSAASPE